MSVSVKERGVVEALRAMFKAKSWFAGQTQGDRQKITKIVADDSAMEARRRIFQHKGKGGRRTKSSPWVRSIFSESDARHARIGADRSIFPGAAAMEFEKTEIRAFKSKFKSFGGVPMLFIPLRKDVRPADWKHLTYGVDWALARKVTIRGHHYIRDSISDRITGQGPAPTLQDKLGFELSRLFEKETLH